MIKKIIAGLVLLFSTVAFSQQNSASPYSFYGIGSTKFKGTADNRSMGGLGIIPDSIHVNLQNPGTYSSLRLTTLSLGASVSLTNFETDTQKDKANRTTIDYLAVALPFNKVGVAFGIMPFTAVGYKLQDKIVGDDGLTRLRQFEGNGGLNRAFIGGSYQITPKFSLGADFRYNFGNIDTKSISGIPSVAMQYQTREVNSTDYKGASFNFGAVYKGKINKTYDWFSSVTYSPEANLNSKTSTTLSTVTISSNGSETIHDEIEGVTSIDDVSLPSKLTFGTGIGKKMKWFAGAEFTAQSKNVLGSRFDHLTNVSYETSTGISVGGYYTPNYMSFTNYFSRVTYRGGFKMEKTGLILNGESINDYGLTLGAGLPLGGAIGSNLNVGIEWGKLGTTKANLVQENYFNIFISLSFNDRWFIKRKYE